MSFDITGQGAGQMHASAFLICEEYYNFFFLLVRQERADDQVRQGPPSSSPRSDQPRESFEEQKRPADEWGSLHYGISRAEQGGRFAGGISFAPPGWKVVQNRSTMEKKKQLAGSSLIGSAR